MMCWEVLHLMAIIAISAAVVRHGRSRLASPQERYPVGNLEARYFGTGVVE